MNWKRAPWIVIDTETTGVDETAKVIELGAVTMCAESYESPRRVVRQRRGMLFNPGIPIPAEATAIHGISDADVADAPTIAEVADRIFAVLEPAPVLVGYNFAFDSRMLSRELGPRWDALVASRIVIDPLVVVRMDSVGRFWRGKGRHKLAAVAERLGVVAERGHRATADCVTAGNVLAAPLDHLPDDPGEADALIKCCAEQQERDFQEWLSRQPPKESAA